MKKMMNLMKMFIKNIQLMFFSKSLKKFDVLARIMLIFYIIDLIYNIFKLSDWIIIDLFFILYFSFYLYFIYVDNE